MKAKRGEYQNDLLSVASNMPKLKHSVPDQDFNIVDSEAVEWLINQPEIKQYIWERVSNRSGSKKLIRFDKDTRTWTGISNG